MIKKRLSIIISFVFLFIIGTIGLAVSGYKIFSDFQYEHLGYYEYKDTLEMDVDESEIRLRYEEYLIRNYSSNRKDSIMSFVLSALTIIYSFSIIYFDNIRQKRIVTLNTEYYKKYSKANTENEIYYENRKRKIKNDFHNELLKILQSVDEKDCENDFSKSYLINDLLNDCNRGKYE